MPMNEPTLAQLLGFDNGGYEEGKNPFTDLPISGPLVRTPDIASSVASVNWQLSSDAVNSTNVAKSGFNFNSIGEWIKQNQTVVFAGVGVIVGLAILQGRGRR